MQRIWQCCDHLRKTVPSSDSSSTNNMSRIGVMGLAVMGQNLALNIADKGFVVSGMLIALVSQA